MNEASDSLRDDNGVPSGNRQLVCEAVSLGADVHASTGADSGADVALCCARTLEPGGRLKTSTSFNRAGRLIANLWARTEI